MIGIPVKTDKKNPEVDERFGRANLFYIIDDNNEVKVIENGVKDLTSGVGGQAVKLLADESVSTIISPHIGPKAMDVINRLGITVYNIGDVKHVDEALLLFKQGKLELACKPQGLKRM